jgi:hypothetical protein
MIGDTVGLAIVALEVFVLFHWLMPTGENRIVLMILAYAIAAGLALYLWYNRKIIEIASGPKGWAAFAGCTILFAAVSFAIDAMVGSVSGSKQSALSAAENAGSPFGFPLTLMLSGVAMAAVAGWVGSFFQRADEGDLGKP